MTTCLNDLEELKDIIDELEPSNVSDINEQDIDDFKETLQYFIGDYIDTHIESYKKKDFETTMFEDVCKLVKQTYFDIFIVDYFKDETDYEYTIWDAMQIYLHKHNAFRSYCNTNIINKPNVL